MKIPFIAKLLAKDVLTEYLVKAIEKYFSEYTKYSPARLNQIGTGMQNLSALYNDHLSGTAERLTYIQERLEKIEQKQDTIIELFDEFEKAQGMQYTNLKQFIKSLVKPKSK